VTWRVYDAGGTYLAGTPLHRPPGTSLSPCCLVVITPSSTLQAGAHSGGAEWWVSSVSHFAAVSLVFSLKIKVDFISIIHHERKKKTYYGPNDANHHLGGVVRELAHLWKGAVLLGFVCVVVVMGVGLDGGCWQLLIVFGGGWGQKEEVVMSGVDGGCMQI
jgi:hypothetical protein